MKAALAIALLFTAASANAAEPVLLFAAASTADAVNDIARQYEAEQGGKVVASYAGTNELLRQLRAGAKAELFLAADESSVDALTPAARVPLLSNELVVIVPADSSLATLTPEELVKLHRVAIADPAGVPAGKYARAWLERRGLWAEVSRELVPALDVRAALAAVASGRAEAGVVYATDAASSKDVRVVYRVPRSEAPPITYTLARLGESEDAKKLYAYLQSPGASAGFARHGFKVIAGAAAESVSLPAAPQSHADVWLVLFTAGLALLSTALLIAPCVALAWWLSRPGARGAKTLVETLVTLPLVLPPTAVGLLLLDALSTKSALGRALDSAGLELVFTWKAVVLATFVMSAPLLIRSVRTAFEELDERLLGVARTLGARPLAVFFRVALPLSWRGVVAGALLAFCRALGEFGATILIAGNIPGRTQTLALAIFQRAQVGEDAAALRLVWITVLLAFFVVLCSELLLRGPFRRRARA